MTWKRLLKKYGTQQKNLLSCAKLAACCFFHGTINPSHRIGGLAPFPMRMQMRRYTRLTTGYSKKIENHCHMVALYTVWYNWIRTHKAHRVTPAMAAGLTDKLMDMADVARLRTLYPFLYLMSERRLDRAQR